jgi:hypothetical protein
MRVPITASPDVQQAFRDVWTVLDPLASTRSIDLSGRRVMNASAAVNPADYVTLGQMRQNLDGIARSLVKTVQTNAPIVYGTHAERLVKSPLQAQGTLFFETDRLALYGVQLNSATTPGTAVWRLVAVYPYPNLLANRWGDLTADDNGFQYFAGTDKGWQLYWTGGTWHIGVGVIRDTFANRPAAYGVYAGGASVDSGVIYVATDRGGQAWTLDYGANAWVLLKGIGNPYDVALASFPSLGANDAGFRANATDFDRVYVWSGSAWTDAPGQPTRGTIAYFTSQWGGATGWSLCDGSTVNVSKSDGSTTPVTLPNLTGSNRFIRSVSGATGGTGGSATTHTHQIDPPNTTSTANSAGHTHQIDPPNTTSSGPSATAPFSTGGTTAPAADNSHTHDVDIGAFTSGGESASHTHDINISAFASAGPSGTGGDDALPPYLSLQPWFRL